MKTTFATTIDLRDRFTPRRMSLLAAAMTVLINPCIASAQNATPILDRGGNGWRSEVVTNDLDYPWDIVRDGDRLFITEKAGTIVVIENGEQRRYPVETSDDLRTEGGAGLLGIALAPDFAVSRKAFLYYSYDGAAGPANRVVAATFDGAAWRQSAILIDEIPGHRLYNGGRVAVGPDGHLYVTTGWTENRQRPQDLDSLAGKVLRVTLEGEIPSDNPFRNSPVYSYGHRNPQGLAWSPSGELFVSEHGQSAHDEINLIQAGRNYGWPVIQGDETHEGMETPFVHSGRDTWAQSGVAFAGNELLVSALQGRGLYVLDREKRELLPVYSSNERYRQVLAVGDDLYVITTNRSPRGSGASQDTLFRISPAP